MCQQSKLQATLDYVFHLVVSGADIQHAISYWQCVFLWLGVHKATL